MSKLPYMPFYVGDYLADTTHLSHIENSAYLLLICSYWQRGSLPAEPAKLARIARMTEAEWVEIEPTLAEFFEVTALNWTHARIEAELSKAKEKSAKARASAERRHQQTPCERNAKADADAERTQCSLDSTQGSKNINTTSEQEPAREVKEVQKFDLSGVELGSARPVSLDAVRQVARSLNLGDAQPLADSFHRWQGKLEPCKRAKDPDALFLTSAAKFFKNASPAVRDACQPLKPPEPEIKPRNVRASPQLLARLSS